MTNWEKLKEVFGISMDTEIEPMCNMCSIVDCHKITCNKCPINYSEMSTLYFWDREYKESKEE